MGCAVSSGSKGQSGGLEVVSLSEEQKELVRNSWGTVKNEVMKSGVILFVRLFEVHPECKEAFFTFRDVPEPGIQFSKELRAHGLRVLSFVEKSVARLGEPERLEQLSLDLGRKHYHYNSNPQYYMYLGVEFIKVIKPILEDSWSSELENAWMTLFLYITQLMKEGYEEAGKQCRPVAESQRQKL
ncbi:neuroglobin-like [Hoplias malabaricus]|uniref:neuroglobin-like n=1 Tax=Hoplias malabaricus TaxID=27720 RepID=UPI0034627228